MTAKRLCIRDIQVTEIFYYDPVFAEDGYQFCRNGDIDCLPSLDEPDYFYRRNDETKSFERQEILPERCIQAHISIFDPRLVDRLSHNHVLFVYEHEELTGVVHFADYNNPAVGDYLYTYLSTYERKLRELANLNKLTDADMGNYFRAKLQQKKESGYFQRKAVKFEKDKEKRAKYPLFQSFYLEDLIGLLKHQNIIKLKGKVVDLRNSVMHAHEFVNMVDQATPDYIYDFSTFQKFFKRAQALILDAKRVENHIRFKQQENDKQQKK